MLREIFIGRQPSHFQVNPVVKAFIISEIFLWSGWNFIAPIFAIFAATVVKGGNIEIAASAYSAHLVTRVIFELLMGKFLVGSSEFKKFKTAIVGISVLGFSYIGLAFTNNVPLLYLFFSLSGAGLGIASPAKNSLFSSHLDKNREATEWGIYDAMVFGGMAMSTALGGFIASSYGFKFLFLLTSAVNLISLIPYILYMNDKKN